MILRGRPCGVNSFRELRENGFTYVDKTAMFLPLADLSVGKQFFIALPRRFGKSLLVSTLHCFIDERNYAEKYDFAGKTVRNLGISFSSEKRTIVDVKTV